MSRKCSVSTLLVFAAISSMGMFWCDQAAAQRGPAAAGGPAPGLIPTPGAAGDGPFVPQPILAGGIVLPLFAPDSPMLKAERIKEPEVFNMTNGVAGRVASIVNIHNPSIEVHTVERGSNTGTAIILVAGGGHRTLNVGSEAGDFVYYFYNYGISCIILRNRLRNDGYIAEVDAVNDALQSIRLVRANAQKWNIDPNKIGIMGFSAGAELAAPAAVQFVEFDQQHSGADDPLAGVSSRPDFVGLLYPGPTPFARNPTLAIPRNAPPSFIASAGSGDRGHAVWANEYFIAMLKAEIPNLEMHIYGNGAHAGGLKDRNNTPFGTWQDRFIDWSRDLGFLNKPGVETKAAQDVAAFLARPAGGGRRGQGGGGNRRGGGNQPAPASPDAPPATGEQRGL